MIRRDRRSGFTLIELLVAMSVIIILASIALLVVPGVLEQDRTTDGAARLQQYLMIAKSRAARDNLPRGIRLLTTDGTTASEIQYIESPPLYLPKKFNETVDTNNALFNLNAVTGKETAAAPRVEFRFNTDANGVVTSKQIQIFNLEPSIEVEMANGGSVIIPALHTWFAFDPGGFDAGTKNVTPNTTTGVSPYPEMGSGTHLVTYQFGVFGPAQPLLGEPVQQLPASIAVDLASSQGIPASLDLLFTPSGDLMYAGAGQVFLWIRDVTKPGGNGGDFANGGEQQVVAIKTRAGSLGVFPIAWSGDPFSFAKQNATGP